MSTKLKMTASSGNVFEDLQVRDPDTALAKAKLAMAITRIIHYRHLTQAEAAEILGIDQPKVSKLMRGRLSEFSTERLFRYLNSLGRDIVITVKKRGLASDPGRVLVNA